MTLAYLKKTPRSGNLPTWMVIGNLMKEPKAEWKTLAREFKAKDLVAALAEIAKDPQANSRAREYALEAIVSHGGKAGLQTLAPALKDDADMTRKIEKAMQKAR